MYARSEAEKEVARFSGNRYLGYTDADGGRVRADRDFQRYVKHKELPERMATLGVVRTQGDVHLSAPINTPALKLKPILGGAHPGTSFLPQTSTTTTPRYRNGCSMEFSEDPFPSPSKEEPIRVYCSGRLSQPTNVCYQAPQLPTPPNTSTPSIGAIVHDDPAPDYISLGAFSEFDEVLDDPCLTRVTKPTPRAESSLCEEQIALVNIVMSGRNVFYTGSAGCGKSTVLKHFVRHLKLEGKKVDILAPTGRAALGINGRTIHNYAGWAPRSSTCSRTEMERHAWKKKVRKRLTETEVLIIDEISMVANHVFERLSRMMKIARGNKQAFGGAQVIVTGDFLQLPPVSAFDSCLECGPTLGPERCEGVFECSKCEMEYLETDKWAFSSAAWEECGFEHINLKTNHRQKDATFIKLLETRRFGRPWSTEDINLLLYHPSETEGAVKLFPLKEEVRKVNAMALATIERPALTFKCFDNFWWNQKHATLRDKGIRCLKPMDHALEALVEHTFESKLVLKEGMLVILLFNLDLSAGLANGSQGTIVGFEKHDPAQIPDAQGDHATRKNGLVREYIKRAAIQEWPIVRFLNGMTRTIHPKCMMNEFGDDEPYSLLSRTQIPLIAGWAMTIHKSQGMTLSRVIVDLSNCFEPGQDYVALSRAESLEGLKVEGLKEVNKGPDAEVKRFMKEKLNMTF